MRPIRRLCHCQCQKESPGKIDIYIYTLVTSFFQLINRLVQQTGDRWLRLDSAIVKHNPDSQLAVRNRSYLLSPGNRHTAGVYGPGTGVEKALYEVFNRGEAIGHWTRHGGDHVKLVHAREEIVSCPFYIRKTKGQGQGQGQRIYNDESHGTRPVVGQIEYKPCRLDGIRIEPPISEPMPRTLPLSPTRAPSPPELPPEMRLGLKALTD